MSTLDSEIKSLEDVVDGDWGPNSVFWSLKGESFEETFGQYKCVTNHALIASNTLVPLSLWCKRFQVQVEAVRHGGARLHEPWQLERIHEDARRVHL